MSDASNGSSVSDLKPSGLATWRARQAEERRLRMAELERYRADATTEVRDGRVYTLVRIPDRYEWKKAS